MEVRLCTVIVLLAAVSSALAAWQSDTNNCGKKYSGVNTMIVGGEMADEYEWPWQAAMYRGGYRICGGSLIAEEWIVTAAHCVSVIYESDIFEFRVGSRSLSNETEVTQRLQAIETYVHPDYNDNTYDNDIALFRVSGSYEIMPDNKVNTVCLPEEDMGADFGVGEEAWVTGWGALVQGGGTPDKLYEVAVPIYNQTECNVAYEGEITDNMICAGIPEGGLDSCQGDSGGPMVALREDDSDQYYLIGIVSGGYGCAVPGFPGVYTRVTQYEDWIAPIFDNDDTTNPTAKTGNCTADEFLCRGGECISDIYRCSGSGQCYHDTDEEFCDGLLKMFDVFYLMRIEADDIKESITNEPSKEACSDHCLDIGCHAFDVTPTGSTFTCDFAMAGYSKVAESNSDRSFNHFELIIPDSGDEFRQAAGVVGSPNYFPGSDTSKSRYTWTVNVTLSSRDSIRFTIKDVTGESTCEDLDSEFALLTVTTVMDGEATAKTSYCLNSDAEGAVFSVHSTEAVVELITTNATRHGFLLDYDTYFDCNNEYMVAPGAVMSPNYPSNYPNGVQCTTHLQAPEGEVVYFTFQTMDVESHPTCRFDSVTLYNGTTTDAAVIEYFCGSKVPSMAYQSTARDMLVVFASDGSVSAGGFKASFDFAKASVPTEDPDIKMINSLEGELSGYKFGMAAACIVGVLLVAVLAASLYTVTMRDAKNMKKVTRLTAAVHKKKEVDNESVAALSEDAFTDEATSSQGSQATKVAIISETGYEKVSEVDTKKNADVDATQKANGGVVNAGFIYDEGKAGEAAALAAVDAVVDGEDEKDEDKLSGTRVVVADVSSPPKPEKEQVSPSDYPIYDNIASIPSVEDE